MTWRVAGAARATIGKRASQEDVFEIWPSGARAATRHGEGLLAVVADGMGGHAGGEIAGQLACRAFVSTFSASNSTAAGRLQSALDAGNSAITAHVVSKPTLRGMGCTLVAAWVNRAGLHWVSVGDSLLLVFRAPEVLRLNADHSLGAYLDEQARRKQISVAEANANPYRNALRSALTGKPIEIVDLHAEPYALKADDWLILASDGIASLAGDEIGDIVYANKAATPEAMAEALITAVLEKNVPDQDNTTVLVLKITEDAVAADEAPTRILRHTPEPEAVTAAVIEPGTGIATTRRIVQPSGFNDLRRNRGVVIGLGMGVMFVIGWALRALLG